MGVREETEGPVKPATTTWELQLRAASNHHNPMCGILPGNVTLLTSGKAKTRSLYLPKGGKGKE